MYIGNTIMSYRTRTYVAGEWDGDSDAIDQLYKWNEGDKWSMHFVDAHKHRQCYDTSMPCTIKSSLSERMSSSKTFVLIVGNYTKSTRKGSCSYYNCGNKRQHYFSSYYCGVAGKTYSTESFIDYECRLAYHAWKNNEMRIVVLYNAASVDKSKCPELLRNLKVAHVAMKSYNYVWQDYRYDYQKVKTAIEG